MNEEPDIPILLPPDTLADYPPLTPAEDFTALMQQSTVWLPAWCGEVWTDFNVHDPGIMVLEQLTYALTELPYRANLDLRRLLVQSDGRIPWGENSLYSPTEILPMHPLTAADYARLLYDNLLSGGKPALVYARADVVSSAVLPGAAGCLQATVIFDPAIPDDEAGLLLIRADRLLADNCNLGQRFEPTKRGRPVAFQLNISLDLAPGAESSAVIARIYAAIKQALLPGPRFRTLEQTLTGGVPMDKALEGPHLTRGVLLDEDLPEPGTWLDAQERATRALHGVPGIQHVVSLSFLPPAQFDEPAFFTPAASVTRAVVPLRPMSLVSGGGALNVGFGGIGAPAGPVDGVETHLVADDDGESDARAVQHAQAYIEAGGETPAVQITSLLPGNEWAMPPAPLPPDPPIDDYYSVQHQFPRPFRLEADALPPDASDAEIVAVRQLKGYLLPFEQLMANYFAQLAHVADFFSNRPQQRTVFTQPLTDVPDGQPLFAGGPDAASPADFWADPANPYITGLGIIGEDNVRFTAQRQRVLDHLLARFNESFSTDDPTTYETIANKETLLQHYPLVSRARALAARPVRESDGTKSPRPRSGLEQKIRTLLRRDLQTELPELQRLAARRQWIHPADFYFVLEPIRFLPRAFSEGTAAPEATVTFMPEDFGPQLFHVFLNWTYRPVTPALRRYAQDLVLENTPAHFWNRPIWIDPLASDGVGAQLAGRFLGLVQAWVMAGSPPLEASAPAAGVTGLQADATTPAARLFIWLKENATQASL